MKNNKIIIESLDKHIFKVNKQKLDKIKNSCLTSNLGKVLFHNIFQPLEQSVEPERYIDHLEKINKQSVYLEIIKADLQDFIGIMKNLRKENPNYYKDLVNDYGELNRDNVYDWFEDFTSDDPNPEPSSFWYESSLDDKFEDLLVEKTGNTYYTAGFSVGQVESCKILVNLFWDRVDRLYQDNLIKNTLKQIYR